MSTYDQRYRPRPDDPAFDREDYDPNLAAKVEDLVPAYCLNGHAVYVWGGPLYVKRGERVLWGTIPLECSKCGASCKGRE